MMHRHKSIKAMWTKMTGKRTPMMSRIEDYSRWTLPYVMPSQYNDVTNEELTVAAGSIGARAVNHLSNKIVSTLFVPYRPFFKLQITEQAQQQLAEQYPELQPATLDLILANTEREGMQTINVAKHRVQAVLAAKYLIVTGNALMYYPEDGDVEVYNIKDYVVQRDLNGKVIKIITRDTKVFSALPDDIKMQLDAQRKKYTEDKACEIYTLIVLRDGKYHVSQAVDDVELETSGFYPVDQLPWIPLTWNLIRGEDYGRGLVEDYAYSFHTYEVLTASQVRLYAIMSDVKFLVDPSSGIDVDELNESESGRYIAGRPDSISTPDYRLQLNLAGLVEKLDQIEREIAQAFMLSSAMTRTAERVTAEEIRMQVTELETAHGGIYSRLAAEWQEPLVRLILNRIDFQLGDAIIPQIITGMEALSRAGDLENLQMFLMDLASTAQIPDDFRMRIKKSEFIAKIASMRNVDPYDFLLTEEEVQAMEQQQQAQQQQMMMEQEQMKADSATQVALANNME